MRYDDIQIQIIRWMTNIQQQFIKGTWYAPMQVKITSNYAEKHFFVSHFFQLIVILRMY